MQVRIQTLFDRLRLDADEAKGHIARVNARDGDRMANSELRRRHIELERLHEAISSQSRELLLMNIGPDDRKMVQEIMDLHASHIWIAIGSYEDMLIERNLSPRQTSLHQERSTDPSEPRLTVKLPDFHLPSFDGSHDSWLKWKETFQSMIHANTTINKVVKYHYLRAAMKFPSGQNCVLENFSLSENCYDAAWEALCKRYDDPKRVKAHLFSRLLTVKKMTGETHAEVTRIIDEFSSAVTSLKLCNASYDDLLVHIVQHRLDDVTFREWQKEIRHSDQISFDLLMGFLTDYSGVVASLSTSSKRSAQNKQFEDNPVSMSKTFIAGDDSGSACVLCHESHLLFACPKFRNMIVSDRHQLVNQYRLCRNCLSSKHIQRNCASSNRCRTCNQNHHSLLHNSSSYSSLPESSGSRSMLTNPPLTNPPLMNTPPVNLPLVPNLALNPQPALVLPPPQPAPSELPAPFHPPTPPRLVYQPRSNFSTTNFHASGNQTFHVKTEALLSTVSIYVLDGNNRWRTARALMDSGSQGNYITTRFARELGLTFTPTRQTITGISGQTSTVKNTADVLFSSRYRPFSGKLGCLVSDDITGVLPNRRINASQLEIPRDLFLADPMFHEPGKIDLLLGTGVYHDAQLNMIIKRPGMPVIMETQFGWTLGGCFPAQTQSSSRVNCYTQQFTSKAPVLDDKIEKLIGIEQRSDLKKIISLKHLNCVEIYKEISPQNDVGEFIEHLPVYKSIQKKRQLKSIGIVSPVTAIVKFHTNRRKKLKRKAKLGISVKKYRGCYERKLISQLSLFNRCFARYCSGWINLSFLLESTAGRLKMMNREIFSEILSRRLVSLIKIRIRSNQMHEDITDHVHHFTVSCNTRINRNHEKLEFLSTNNNENFKN